MRAIYLPAGCLAIACGDNAVRMWDLANDDNCTLSLTAERGYANNDGIRALTYCAKRGVLVVGTQAGMCAMWRRRGRHVDVSASDNDMAALWRLQVAKDNVCQTVKLPQAPIHVNYIVKALDWSGGHAALGVITSHDIFVIQEQLMLHCTSANVGKRSCLNAMHVES